jgi:cytochrome c-type biogenesis protein CcmH/NrfG
MEMRTVGRSNQGDNFFHRPPVRASVLEKESAVESGHNLANSKDSKPVLQILDKIIGASLFMMVFGLPLFFTGIASQGIIFEKQLYFYFWLLLALISWSAKGVINEEMHIRRTPLDIPIVVFWFFYLLATFFSVDRWHSFWGAFGDPSRGLMSVTAMIITYYLIVSNFNEKRLRLLFSAFVSSGIVLSLWTLGLFFNFPFTDFSLISLIPESLVRFIPLSLIGSVTGLGVFLSSMIILLSTAILKVAENEEMKIWKKNTLLGFLMLVLVLDLFLILNIGVYIVWLGLFLGIVLFLVYILSKIVRPHRNWVWLPMVLFVLIMIVKMIGSVSLVSDKINLPTEVNADSFAENYKASLSIASNSLKNDFFVGSGPATYAYDFSLHKPAFLNESIFYGLRFSQGSGIFFEAISTIGGVGTIIFVILLLSYLSISFYLISREKEKNKLFSLGLFSAAVIAIASVATTKLEGSVLFFAVLLGIISLATILFESEAKPRYLSLSLKASPKFALALAFIFMLVSAGVAFLFVFLGKVYVADVYAGKAMEESGRDQEAAIEKMGRAINLNSREGLYYTKAGVYYMMLANKEALKTEEERNVDNIRQYINYSVSAAVRGVEMHKTNIEAVEVLAQVYENSGMYVADSLKLAEDSYKKALALDPRNPDFFLKLGQIKIAEGARKEDEEEKKRLFGEAKEFFQKAIDEKNNFAPGYYQLGLIEDALGESDQAIENMTKAAQLDPKSLDYLASLGNMYRIRAKNDDLKVAQEIFKIILQKENNNINAHFYLGMAYEKDKNKEAAKEEYRTVISSLPEEESAEVKKQLEKMISNLDRGIENSPENLGLAQEQEEKKDLPEDPAPQDTNLLEVDSPNSEPTENQPVQEDGLPQ